MARRPLPPPETSAAITGGFAELAALLPAGSCVADLGCGAGVPATRELAALGLRVVGVDFSAA